MEQLVTFSLDNLGLSALTLVLVVPWKEYTHFNIHHSHQASASAFKWTLDRSKCTNASVNAGARCEHSFYSVRVLKAAIYSQCECKNFFFKCFRHIKEHYEGKMQFNDSDMTPEELEFHYFK